MLELDLAGISNSGLVEVSLYRELAASRRVLKNTNNTLDSGEINKSPVQLPKINFIIIIKL